MFGLIHGLWKMATAKPEFAVCIVGLDGAGKTVCGPSHTTTCFSFATGPGC